MKCATSRDTWSASTSLHPLTREDTRRMPRHSSSYQETDYTYLEPRFVPSSPSNSLGKALSDPEGQPAVVARPREEKVAHRTQAN